MNRYDDTLYKWILSISFPSEVVDRINHMHGSETIVLGSQQYTQKNGKGKAEVFANAIKHNFKSPLLHVGLT